jgi:hypothetical protein
MDRAVILPSLDSRVVQASAQSCELPSKHGANMPYLVARSGRNTYFFSAFVCDLAMYQQKGFGLFTAPLNYS